MPKILLTTRYTQKPLEILESILPSDYTLIMLDQVTQEDLIEKSSQAEYLLVSGRLKIDAFVLDRMASLKMIQRTGVGLDSMSLDEIAKRKIPVYVNAGVNADSVAEHTVLLMLAGLRRLPVIDSNVKRCVWEKQNQGTLTRTLKGRNVGIIGMGNIGKAAARLLRPFGAAVFYYNRHRLSPEEEEELNISYLALPDILEQSDIISLHCPVMEDTKHLICRKTISRMKDGVIIVNTARGRIICEEDLIHALSTGKVGFAGLDVFENEPLRHSKLTELKNVILTPHIAGVTYDAFYRMMHDAVRNIKFFEEGRLPEIEQYRLKQGEE